MKKAENAVKGGCPQRDSTECKGYAGARSAVQPEAEETAGRRPDLLEKILDRENLNNAYRRVKANKGAPGVDGMTVEEALPWLKEHGKELTESTCSRPREALRRHIAGITATASLWNRRRNKEIRPVLPYTTI